RNVTGVQTCALPISRSRKARHHHVIFGQGQASQENALSETSISTSLECARRLAVTKQHLAGKLPTGSGREAILSVIRDLGYVQLDRKSVVAPSHVVALWSRLGMFRLSDLDRL